MALKRGCYSMRGRGAWKCRHAPEMGSPVPLLMAALLHRSRALTSSHVPWGWVRLKSPLLQRERCMCFMQCRIGAARFLCACRNAGEEGSWSTRVVVGRCKQQPRGLHGLSVHGSDTSGTCWGSAQTSKGDFFRHTGWRVLSQGRLNRRGLVWAPLHVLVVTVACLVGFAGSGLNAEGQNPNSCSYPHPRPKSPKISHFFTDFHRVLYRGSIPLAP